MKHANIIRILFYAAALLLALSCRKVFKDADWDPEAVFPIAHTELSYSNIFSSDSTNIKPDADGLLSVVFEQNLDSLTFSVLDTFTAPPFYRNFKLDSLRLVVPDFNQQITLGQLARQLIAGGGQNGLLGSLILQLHGNTIASSPYNFLVPNTISVPLGSLPIDLNQFFQTAELRSGTVTLRIDNRFPMDISRLNFDVRNVGDQTVLLQESNIQIPKNTTFLKDYDLAGKIVEGRLAANITTLDLLTDRNVIIDTNQYIGIGMSFSNLQVISATAIFPDQDVVSDYQVASLENMGELELKEAIIEEGNVVMEVTSTLQDSIFMTFSMPKTTFNGAPLVFNGVVPPAQPGSTNSVRLEVPVTDYKLNLSSPPDYFNRFVYSFNAHVKYTGKKVSLSLKDSIEINVYMKSIRPKYVRGYLGSLDTNFSSSILTDAFTKIQADAISPAEVDVKLKVENSLGVSGIIQFDHLKASNAKGEVLDAVDPTMIGTPLAISAATDLPFQSTNTLIQSSPTSNFPDLISLMPTRFDFQFKASVGGLPKDTNSFVYNTSKLKSNLEIEMPLHLSAQGLLLRDTINIESSQITFDNSGGALTLIAYNGFPLSGKVRAIFMPSAASQGLTLESTGTMLAADVDLNTARAVGKKRSTLVFPFTEGDLNNIVQAKQLILEAKFDTPPNGQKVKIYSDYSIQLTLTAKIAPKISR